MEANEYQKLASRTMNQDLTKVQQSRHAVYGLVSEVGEICGIYQKKYQGHGLDETHIFSELGDALWFIAELCEAKGWNLSDVMQHNIDKLKARYPKGFEETKSLNRAEGDI